MKEWESRGSLRNEFMSEILVLTIIYMYMMSLARAVQRKCNISNFDKINFSLAERVKRDNSMMIPYQNQWLTVRRYIYCISDSSQNEAIQNDQEYLICSICKCISGYQKMEKSIQSVRKSFRCDVWKEKRIWKRWTIGCVIWAARKWIMLIYLCNVERTRVRETQWKSYWWSEHMVKTEISGFIKEEKMRISEPVRGTVKERTWDLGVRLLGQENRWTRRFKWSASPDWDLLRDRNDVHWKKQG